jgi:hydroxypyruvate isomerase
MHRRDVLMGTVGGAILTGLTRSACGAVPQAEKIAPPVPPGRLKQSVCRWCYADIALDELCERAKAMGLLSVELLKEEEWATPAKHGLVCAVGNGPTSIAKGYNRIDNHDRCTAELQRLIPIAAEVGVPNIIVFSGNRDGMSDEQGLEHCATGLSRIMSVAEKHGVTLVMELLNSRVDHQDYMCDKTPWGVRLVEKVGSERFKLLYDIYHMQIMEGDIIRTIRDHGRHIAHYHTAGVPGRREIDQSQELNYPAICRAIVETGFTGYLAQEFIPSRDALESLAQAVALCTVSP